MSSVRDAEDAVERVMDMATSRYAQSQSKLDQMLERTAELPDGAKVARSDKDELVYTLDGVVVDQDEAAQIKWTGREPSFEDLQAAEDRANADYEILTGARQDVVRLGEIREEMESNPEADRVKDLQEEAEAIENQNTEIANSLSGRTFEASSNNGNFDFTAAQPIDLAK